MTELTKLMNQLTIDEAEIPENKTADEKQKTEVAFWWLKRKIALHDDPASLFEDLIRFAKNDHNFDVDSNEGIFRINRFILYLVELYRRYKYSGDKYRVSIDIRNIDKAFLVYLVKISKLPEEEKKQILKRVNSDIEHNINDKDVIIQDTQDMFEIIKLLLQIEVFKKRVESFRCANINHEYNLEPKFYLLYIKSFSEIISLLKLEKISMEYCKTINTKELQLTEELPQIITETSFDEDDTSEANQPIPNETIPNETIRLPTIITPEVSLPNVSNQPTEQETKISAQNEHSVKDLFKIHNLEPDMEKIINGIKLKDILNCSDEVAKKYDVCIDNIYNALIKGSGLIKPYLEEKKIQIIANGKKDVYFDIKTRIDAQLMRDLQIFYARVIVIVKYFFKAKDDFQKKYYEILSFFMSNEGPNLTIKNNYPSWNDLVLSESQKAKPKKTSFFPSWMTRKKGGNAFTKKHKNKMVKNHMSNRKKKHFVHHKRHTRKM